MTLSSRVPPRAIIIINGIVRRYRSATIKYQLDDGAFWDPFKLARLPSYRFVLITLIRQPTRGMFVTERYCAKKARRSLRPSMRRDMFTVEDAVRLTP